MSGKPSAVTFDLDGTLVHSAPDLHRAGSEMLAAMGRAPVSLATTTGFIGNGVRVLVRRLLAATGGVPDEAGYEAAVAHFHAAYDRDPAALTRPYPGVPEALARLAGAGLALGLCTNKPEPAARRLLARFGLERHFRAVVGSAAGRPLKPDPAPLRLCLALLAAEPAAALHVGDGEADAAAARAVPMRFALFAGGYRQAGIDALAPDLAFDDFARLPALLAPS